MKIIQNNPLFKAFAIKNNQVQANNSISFGSNVEEKTQTSVPAVTPDYNVRVPIGYTQLDDVKLNDDITAKMYKLANGQRVVIVPKEGSTFIKSYVNTGSFNEPDNLRGISHYIEHNLFNGSEDLGDREFFNEVNNMGAYTNASTNFSVTDYFISSQLLEDTDFENQIQLHAGMVQSPKFLIDKLEKEKKIVNSEINMCVSENENLGFTQTLKNLFNIKSTSLDLVAGSTDNITNLTRDDVVKYFNENYYPANIVTVITGEVDPDKTIKLVSKYFNSTKVPSGTRKFEKLTPIEKPVRQDIISPKSQSEAATIMLGFAGPENNNTKDKIYLQALSYLVGGLYNSRTSNLEREFGGGISFSPERISSRPEDKSLYMIEAEVNEDKVEPFLHKLYEKVNDLSNNPPTDEEFTAIKNWMKKFYELRLESSASVNYAFGRVLLNDNLDELVNYNEIIDNMTPQDVVNVARKYVNLNKVALTVVHPYGTTEEKIKNANKLVSSVSFTGNVKKNPIKLENISTYRTSNNYDVTFNNIDTNNLVYSLVLKNREISPKNPAIVSVLSDMLENAGTTNKSIEQISKDKDLLASDESISVGNNILGVSATFHKNVTKEVLQNINDRIKNPNFTQEEFEKSVARVKDILLSYEVSPSDKFNKEIYVGTPRVNSPKDCLEGLKTLKLNDVKDFYNELLENAQGAVTVSGSIDKNPEIKDEIFNSIVELKPVKTWNVALKKVYSPIKETKVLTDVNKKNQASIIEGFKFYNNGNLKDKNAVELLNTILGGSTSSRLFSDLRETRHLAYAVHSYVDYYGDMGVLGLSIGTTTENQETGEKTFDNVKKSIEGFNENIQKIMNEKVTQEELNSAKKKVKTQILSSFDSNFMKNLMLETGKAGLYGLDYINKRLENIDEITVDDIQNAARKIFSSKPVYSLTATQATLDANKEYLDSLAK